MNITHFGTRRSQITIVFDRDLPVQPRIISGTRWLLLNPALLDNVQQHTSSGYRASGLSSSTWQSLQRAYMLEAYPISRYDNTYIYTFGRPHNRIALIHTLDDDLILNRVGSSSVITTGPSSSAWFSSLIARCPRNTWSAIALFSSHGLPFSNRIMKEQFPAIPRDTRGNHTTFTHP